VTAIGWLQAVIFFLVILAITKPLGSYMARVFQGERTLLSPILVPLEKVIYRVCGIREDEEMSWYAYALSMLAFSLIGLAYLYILLRTQKWLPFNPQHIDNMSPDLAWNTAVSFTTNTNWQFYSGETAMSYLSQMAGLAWHNFVSAAAGIAIAVAVVRGLIRTNVKTLGSFWIDLTRC
jgi:K+-transporting ATPase ATPase A chain